MMRLLATRGMAGSLPLAKATLASSEAALIFTGIMRTAMLYP